MRHELSEIREVPDSSICTPPVVKYANYSALSALEGNIDYAACIYCESKGGFLYVEHFLFYPFAAVLSAADKFMWIF